MQGTWVPSLVRELRSPVPQSNWACEPKLERLHTKMKVLHEARKILGSPNKTRSSQIKFLKVQIVGLKKICCFKPHFLELHNIPCGCFCSLIFTVSVDRTFDNTGAVWISHWRKKRGQRAASVHFMSMMILSQIYWQLSNKLLSMSIHRETKLISFCRSVSDDRLVMYYLCWCLSRVRQAGYKFWLWTSYWWDLNKILGFSTPVFSAVTMWISISSVQFRSVTQSCPTLCDPMNCSMPGLPVHHQLLEPTQTHVHWVGDAIQPFHPLLSPSPPALNLSQHRGLFKWVSSLHQVAKVLKFQFQHQSFQWTARTYLP